MRRLSGTEKKYLRGLAHHLKPVVQVGRNGLNVNLISNVDKSLLADELIKVKFGECKEQKVEISEEIVRQTDSALAGIIGNIAVLYRPHPEVEKRSIHLPRA